MGLDELREKYEEILRLRELHAAPDEPDPRRAMAELASRFPGALREIDVLTLDEVRARISALDAAERGEAAPAPWMLAVARYHALTRGALCAKSWLAGRKDVGDEARDAFAREAGTLCWAEDARAWTDTLAAVASPPRGRVTDLVFVRIAAELGVSEDEARALVLPTSRGRHRTRAPT